MERKLYVITLVASLAVLLSMVGATGQGPEPKGAANREGADAGASPVEGEVAVTGAVNSRISYQGMLKEDGAPVTGSRDMLFRLYSDGSCATQVGDNIPKSDVEVENGLFSVELDVSQGDLNGQGLWLEVQVAGTPIGCQEILPAPYALGLRPGATVIGAVPGHTFFDRSVLEVHNTSTGANAHGIKSTADASSGIGVWGLGPRNGVRGWATADSGMSIGVNGGSTSPDGKGVYGSSTHYDSYGYLGGGYMDPEFLIPYGVGAYGFAEVGKGVHGSSVTGYGVYGSSTSGVGVYGASSSGYAGHFVGTVRTSILEIAGGSDLAEPFEITGAESIRPGTVVAIDPQHPGQLRVAQAAYDRTVAGCVSGANGIQPGLTMAQEGTVADGALPVALSGRVYCWADAAYGRIEPGDLLTTSDTPGHAMAAADPTQSPGAVLGKAMSALESGRGLVLVLVSLQ